MTPLFKKLNLGTHETILVLNAPDSFEAELIQLAGIKVLRKIPSSPNVPFVIGFATNQMELDQLSDKIIKSITGDAIAWVAYPKKSSKRYKCDFNRDEGWNVLGEADFEPVRQVAIDEDWSALRFRRVEHIKTLTRNKDMAISIEGKRRTKK